MATTDYIRLPSLRKIFVQNYSLFTKSWSYDLNDGLNLFIGANGLGKTTTTFLIIYGIVGEYQDIKLNYFRQRSHYGHDEENPATVTIDFVVSKNSFSIERYLDENKIKQVTINDASYDETQIDNLDDFYNDTLKEYTGINDITDLCFILKNFMIREEEGNYLLWDVLDQSKLIRLLINYSGFQQEYNKLALKVQEYDTIYRDNSNFRYQFIRRQNELKNKKEETLKKKQGYILRKEIEEKIKIGEEEINDLKYKRKRILDNISYFTENIKNSNKEIEQVSFDFESVSEEIISLEREFYGSIYSNDKILSAIHKLKTYNICIYCNTKPENDISKKIINTVEHLNNCPVCNSHLNERKSIQKPSKDIINKIKKLKKDGAEFHSKLLSLKELKESTSADLDVSYSELKEIDNQINPKFVELLTNKQKLAESESNSEETISEFDTEIIALQNQIDQYNQIIETSLKNFNRGKDKLIKKNDELNQTINSFTAKLNNIFSKYASEYFNNGCDLITYEQNVKKSKVPITTFIPKFDDIERYDKYDCSTSERVFLEYLYRFSLIELYNKLTRNDAFIILETSEGAFDITNTKQLSNAIISFAKNEYPFIIIANFSKPDFLGSLLAPYNDRNERVLNFLKFSRLSSKQEKSKKDFSQVLDNLKLKSL